MKHFYRILAFIFLFAVLACLFSNTVWAKEKENDESVSIIIDCSKDQMAYGEMIAQLNRAAEENILTEADSTGAGKRGQLIAYHAVLCRTDGRELSFESWNPQYIIAGPSNCYTLFFMSNTEAEKAVEELSSIEGIRYAELDSTVQACGDDKETFQSWCAERIGFGQYNSYAKGCFQGDITVAIIDSGAYLHPFYSERIKESGYDYVDADGDATNDLFGHGTNVTGIVADCTNGFPVYLYPIRVLDARGSGSNSNVVNAIREAMVRGVGVINLSLVSDEISAAIDDAVLDALNAGITVVAAAGNSGLDAANFSPSHLTCPGMLVIGAAEDDDSIAAYSNFGESVDLFTYGTDILCCSRRGGFTKATGTSVSAPHITGLSALVALTHPEIRPSDIEIRIKCSVDIAKPVKLPELQRIIPAHYGLSLTALEIDLEDRVQLPTEIRPTTAMEYLQFKSSDEMVLSFKDGCIIPKGVGEAIVTVSCPGLEDCFFSVTVEEKECTYVVIPRGIRRIENEAFYGDSEIEHVRLPDGLEELGTGVFDACEKLRTVRIPASVSEIENNSFSDAVLFCAENSAAHAYAVKNRIPYILDSP